MTSYDVFDSDLLEEAGRQFTICNACRYCEGYCPVWPAAHMRTLISNPDSIYLSNLCYDHRDCYYACPFVEPVHEFALNVPKITRQIRKDTYQSLVADFTSSKRNLMVLMASAILPLVVFWVMFFPNIYSGNQFSFYSLVPKTTTIGVSSALSIYGILLMSFFMRRYIMAIEGEGYRSILDTPYIGVANLLRTVRDVASHKWFSTIHYPGEEESNLRAVSHAMVFYGFGLAFLSTVLGFIYEDALGIPSPFGLFTPVVLSGLAGGILIISGSALLLYARALSSRNQEFMGISLYDTTFVIFLLVVALTGIVVLVGRLEHAFVASYLLLMIHYSSIFLMVLVAPLTSNMLHIVARFASVLKYNYETHVHEN